VRIRQYAYFALISNTLTASDITGRLGIEPDAISIRGSQTPDPPVPRHHSWRITSNDQGLSVAEHMDHIIDRLGSHEAAIGELVLELVAPDTTPRLGSVLGFVRHFENVAGEDEEMSLTEIPHHGLLEELPGQHQLLGWHLSPRAIDFLWMTHASLDFDEYG
jgi:Domain of unknown function (DUF4279)